MRWSCWSFSWTSTAEWTVSTAPGVCVCVCPLLQVCVCALGWVKCREHISLLIIFCIIVHVTNKNKKYIYIFFFQNRYPIMVKCLNIWKNIGKPIYRSISSSDVYRLRARLHWMSFSNLRCSSVALLCKQALDRHFWPVRSSRVWNGVIKCFCENGLVRATGLWRRILYWINFTVEKYISPISVIVLSVSVDVLIHAYFAYFYIYINFAIIQQVYTG